MKGNNDLRSFNRSELQCLAAVCMRLHQTEPDQQFVHHCRAILDNAIANIHFSAVIHNLNPDDANALKNAAPGRVCIKRIHFRHTAHRTIQ